MVAYMRKKMQVSKYGNGWIDFDFDYDYEKRQ